MFAAGDEVDELKTRRLILGTSFLMGMAGRGGVTDGKTIFCGNDFSVVIIQKHPCFV